MAFDSDLLKLLVKSIKLSPSLMGAHLCNHEAFNDVSFLAEISTILAYNYQ